MKKLLTISAILCGLSTGAQALEPSDMSPGTKKIICFNDQDVYNTYLDSKRIISRMQGMTINSKEATLLGFKTGKLILIEKINGKDCITTIFQDLNPSPKSPKKTAGPL